MTTRNTFTRAASLAPSSWNADARTIEVSFTTFADVQRLDARGPYIERLDPNGMNLSGLVGASVLNAHRQSGLGDVIGVVLKASKAGSATLQLSSRDDVAPFVADIAAGIIRHLSIGYTVQEWRESTDPKSGARVKTAVRWSPRELSFVPVPADFGATTRNQTMDPETPAPELPAPQQHAQVNELATRNAAVRTLCRSNGMSQEFTDSLIDNPELDLIAARAAVNAEIVRRTPVIRPQQGVSNDDPSVILERQTEGLHCRLNGGTPSDAARQYVGLSVAEHADLINARNGVSTAGQPREARMDLAIRSQGAHGTSDFSELLTGVGRRTLLGAYTSAASPLKTVARSTTAVDFRTKSALRLSGAGLLEEISEHGEIKSTTRYETKESYALRTFARNFGISRKALINDDLGAFNDSARVFGIAAAQTEADQLVSLLTANSGAGPNLDDGNPLFHASRGNLDAMGSPIGIESIHEARLGMRKLTDADGTLISVGPRYLVVSAELETEAQKFVAAYQPQWWKETNPLAALTVLVEPRLPEFAWYLFADPATAPVLEYAHLASAQGPVIESQPAWQTLGLSVRCYLDFGCGAVGWKGAYRNADGSTGESN
jgi:hypothetical protein